MTFFFIIYVYEISLNLIDNIYLKLNKINIIYNASEGTIIKDSTIIIP